VPAALTRRSGSSAFSVPKRAAASRLIFSASSALLAQSLSLKGPHQT
jgi:hypothetical protein